jgi:5,10-methylene-tetrahydrofolate dehydrogenase/methenyl tetrahydrofolate cyclohydrolase
MFMDANNEKILDVKSLIEKYDMPAFACNHFFYEQNEISPCLAVILTSDDAGSISYTKGIKSFCKKNNINCLDFNVSNETLLIAKIEELNNDDSVHGIMIMYPTGYGTKDSKYMNMVNPMKDVEGLHHIYLGYLVQFEKFRDADNLKKLVIPPTAKGILSIIKRYAMKYEEFKQKNNYYPQNLDENPFNLEGKRITIINDSLAVGRSLALMLLNENAYVQVCHEYTPFNKVLSSVSKSDFIISAVPSAKFVIPTEFVPENSIVIDISFEGNFQYPSVIDKCFRIAPKWDLCEKGNRINDMTLNRLVSNLFYLINTGLPENVLKQMSGVKYC